MASAHKPSVGGRSKTPRELGGVIWDLGSRYFVVGAVLGLLSGVFAVSVHKFLKDEETILLAMAGASVALLAVILTATALMAGFLRDFFGLVIDTAVGLRAFFRPFRIMAWVCAAAALVSFGAAMEVNSKATEAFHAALFGLASGLTTWAIVGNVWLISIFIDEAAEERRAKTELEEAEEELEEA